MYPHENWFPPNCKNDERKRRVYDPTKRIDAEYQIPIGSQYSTRMHTIVEKIKAMVCQRIDMFGCLERGFWLTRKKNKERK